MPDDLDSVTTRGEELPSRDALGGQASIEALWSHLVDVYKTGMHPAIQVCVRHRGDVVLHRAIGHASGNSPADAPDAPTRPVDLETPINIFSAAKSVTAMVIHQLAARGEIHLDDWVSDYIPDFARHGKERITIRHVLAHRAGLPNLPRGALDLDLLDRPGDVLELLCDARLQSRPGRLLAYHAVTGGFVLKEVAERATGRTMRELLREQIAEPMGLRWMNFGVDAAHVAEVAQNAYTGPPPPPPFGSVLDRALGMGLREVVELSNDPRFLTGVLPSANVITTADEMSTFYQCLLDDGRHEGKAVFDRRTVRHAVAEQSWWEIDFTLMAPIRYGLGFMLGNKRMGPFGADTEQAFGHVGLSNVFCWADPERNVSVGLLTTGKPIAASHVVPLFRFIGGIGTTFPKAAAG